MSTEPEKGREEAIESVIAAAQAVWGEVPESVTVNYVTSKDEQIAQLQERIDGLELRRVLYVDRINALLAGFIGLPAIRSVVLDPVAEGLGKDPK